SRYFHHGHNRLMLEQLEDRTLLSGNPYTDFITTFDSNLNGQVTNLQTTLGNGFSTAESTIDNINNIPFLTGQNLFGQLKNAEIASSQFFSTFENMLKGIQLPTADDAVAQLIKQTFPGLITFAKVNSTTGNTLSQESVEFDLHFHQDANTAG